MSTDHRNKLPGEASENEAGEARTEARVDADGGGSEWLVRAGAVLVGSVAVTVLAGWHFDVPVLRAASPGRLNMPPLAAGSLLLGAGALWLLYPRAAGSTRTGFGNVLAALLCALGLATCLEYAANVELGFDLLLYPRAVLGEDARPAGRLAPVGALAFVLIGISLLLLSSKGFGERLAQWIALATVLLVSVPLLGFVYRIPVLYRVPGVAPMALHTCLALLALALSVLFARPRIGAIGKLTGRDPGGVTARRLLPIGLLLPVALGAVVAEILRAHALPPTQGLLLVATLLSIIFSAVVWRSAMVLRRIDQERRQAASALEQSEERFRSLAENASDAMITIDARSKVVFANPAAERLFGYTAEQLANMRLTQLMPERFREAHREGVKRHERTGARRIPWSGVEFIGLTREDREIPLEITLGEYVRDGRTYFTGIIRDITERRRTEAAQRLLLEAGRVLSASLDHEATLRGVTRLAVAELADWCVVYRSEPDGIGPLEMAARDLVREVRLREIEHSYAVTAAHPVSSVVETGKPQLLAELTDAFVENLAENDDHLHMLREVGYRSLVMVPLVARGRTIGALVLGAAAGSRDFDITDVNAAQELAARIAFAVDNARLYEAARSARAQAEARARELERVTESRARLMRGFSHDLKNPLGAADGHAQLLESGTLGELTAAQVGSLGNMRRAMRNAFTLIDELVELALTESGQIQLHVRPIDVSHITQEVAREYRPKAETKGLALVTKAPPVRATLADAARVRQIIGNLLSNAIKYTDEGSVQVHVRAPDDGAPKAGVWNCVEIADTGPGIPLEHQALLFDEFTRFTDEQPGSGLGLAISRNLAEAQGGTITVQSAPGEGTRFTLWLPAAVAKAPEGAL
jgi:PAS domain S-box-containing protein